MSQGSRFRQVLAIAALAGGVLVVLAFTGPRPDLEISGSVPRYGGVCVELEQWQLFGWQVIGQTHTVLDTRDGVWHEAVAEPPCAEVPLQTYRIRMPIDAPNDAYRICGLADDQACIEFSRTPFEGTPGP